MKRDWDVIRDILVEVEAVTDEERALFKFDGHTTADDAEKVRAWHAALLVDEGYLTGKKLTFNGNGAPLVAMPNLTWAGHDLLDTLRSKRVWERIKTTAKEKGIELTVDAVKALGKAALDYVIKQGTGDG